jgi:hypothetical protein
MNKEAIFEFIRKNIVSLCCGVVAIAAIVLVFYPLGGMVDDLSTQANTHAGVYATLSGYVKTRKIRAIYRGLYPIRRPLRRA